MEQENLRKRIARNEDIVSGLESSTAFQMMVEDFQKSVELADQNWHLINVDDKDLFYQLKYNKMSALGIINAIENYKSDITQAKKRLAELDGVVQGSYYEE